MSPCLGLVLWEHDLLNSILLAGVGCLVSFQQIRKIIRTEIEIASENPSSRLFNTAAAVWSCANRSENVWHYRRPGVIVPFVLATGSTVNEAYIDPAPPPCRFGH